MAARLVDGQPGRKLTLAGGLTAETVAAALAAVRPWGVDVGVGVESSPGRFDPAKVKEFLAAVERAESGSG
jgi:phosphoribosylanthranilate isomerase